MPNVLDSLVIEFGLDPTKFTTGQRALLDSLKQTQDEARRRGGEVEAQGKRIAEAFNDMKRGAVGMAAMLLGGMGFAEFTKFISNSDAALSRMAVTMDVSAKELAAWEGVSKRTGGATGQFTNTLQTLSSAIKMFEISGGQGPIAGAMGALTQLGVGLRRADGTFKTSIELFDDLTEASKEFLDTWQDPAMLRAILSTIPGIDQNAINLIMRGREELAKMLDEQRKIAPLNKEAEESAKEFQEAMGRTSEAATGLGRTLFVALEPALTAILNAMTRIVSKGFPDLFAKMRTGELGTPADQTFWGRHPYILESMLPAPFNVGFDLGRHFLGRMLGGGPAGAVGEGSFADRFGAWPQTGGAAAGNWGNFLSGLSYLESSQTGAASDRSSATGFFQVLRGTAAKAVAAGIPDPRFGSYLEQAAATQEFIRRFYPDAATAIDKGDFMAAARMLSGEWPSLPGGDQPQSQGRYRTWQKELHGGGPRPPIFGAPAAAAARTSSLIDNRRATGNVTTDRSVSVEISELHVNAPLATDAQGIAGELETTLARAVNVAGWNTGMT